MAAKRKLIRKVDDQGRHLVCYEGDDNWQLEEKK